MASDVVNTFLLVVAGLFPIVNPLGSAPIFLDLTRRFSEVEQHALARRVAINGFALLLGSLFVGSYVLEFFGISLPVVRVAGGFVVTTMGWRLLTKGEGQPERDAARESSHPPDAFYPLTMPLTVGPGSISVAITLGSHRPEGTVTKLVILAGAGIAGLFAIAAAIWISYRYAASIARFLGETGINVLIRLSAFILMCIGIEIAWTGASALLATLGRMPS